MAYELSSTPSAVMRHRLDAIAAIALSLTRRNGPDVVRNGSKSTHDEGRRRRAKCSISAIVNSRTRSKPFFGAISFLKPKPI